MPARVRGRDLAIDELIDVRDGLPSLTAPVHEGPAVQPQRRLLGLGQRAGVDHVVLDRVEGVAMTHTEGDLRLNLLERGQQRPPRFSVSRLGPLGGTAHSTFGSGETTARAGRSSRLDRSDRPNFRRYRRRYRDPATPERSAEALRGCAG